MNRFLFFVTLFLFCACSTNDDSKATHLIREGNEYLNQKNYSSALISFKDASKYKLSLESKIKNLRNMSICSSNLDKLDEAKKYAKESYEIAETNSYYFHNNKGEYLLLEDKVKEALLEFKKAYKLNESAMEVNNNLSLIYAGAYGENFINLTKALANAKKAYHSAENASNKEQLAGVYFQLEEFDEAGDLFKALNTEFPQVKLYQFNYGQCLYFSGKEEQGIALMEEAAARDEVCKQLFEELID